MRVSSPHEVRTKKRPRKQPAVSECDSCGAYRCGYEVEHRRAELHAWAHDRNKPECEFCQPVYYNGIEGVLP